MFATHFITPGELPLDALTRFGINHKPNTESPLGYFGTGLKYAVAIVLRLGGSVALRTDKGRFEFYAKPEDFRGKEFQGVRMRRTNGVLARWTYEKLPFTTELGKNWHLWQAYRELVSNTFDENGYVGGSVVNDGEDPHGGRWVPGISVLTVLMPNPDFDTYRAERSMDVHLPVNRDERQPVLFENDRLTVYSGEARCVYYRGVRVFDFQSGVRSYVTYDFKTGVTLSEDRTVRNQWEMYRDITRAIDRLPQKLVEGMMAGGSDVFEATHLPMDPSYVKESGSLRNLSARPSGYYAGSMFDYFDRSRLKSDSDIGVTISLTGNQWLSVLGVLKAADVSGEGERVALESFTHQVAGDTEVQEAFAETSLAHPNLHGVFDAA